MTKARVKRGAVLLTLFAAVFSLCGCALPVNNALVREADRELNAFDPGTEGLVEVVTVHESNGKAAYFALASEMRYMETGAFSPDETRVFTVDSFSIRANLPVRIRVRDEEGNEAPMTREINAICRAMREIDHHVIQCRVFGVGEECFVSAMLNVNWWTPYQFYYFNRESGRLFMLFEFANRDVAAIRVLDHEGLRLLDGDGIGGWPDCVTPERLMAEEAETLENVARVLLGKEEIFDEARERNIPQERRITADGSLSYDSLLYGVTYYSAAGKENRTYLTDEEKTAFLKLLDRCAPSGIEWIPGDGNTYDALLFGFSVFNDLKERQEETEYVRIADTADPQKYVKTVSSLEERLGPLTECALPGWLRVSPAEGD